MTRLSVRIFVSFWLVIGLTLAITFAVNRATSRADVERERVATLQSSLAALAAQAGAALTTGGEPARRDRRAAEVASRPEPALLVIAPDGRELLGRPVPPVPRRWLDRLREAGERPASRPRGPFPVRVLVAADGARYLLFVRPPGGRGRFLGAGRSEPTLWLVLLVVSGIACLVLARQVTQPVRALRAAGARLGAGELAARVGPAVGARRDELGALAREFDGMAARLEGLVSGQQQLLRDLSHELRSPLARLQAAVALLRQRQPDAGDADLDRIERETERLDGLIGQILALSRLQGRAPPARLPVDLAALLGDVVDDARYEAGPAGKRVTLAADAPTVAGDDAVLRSAFDNLVRNAVEHAASAVQVTVRADAGRVVVTVADDGPGVPAEALPRLFAPFYQVPGRAGRGSGLGLAIAARAVELHGGTLVAAASPGGGLAVTATLPV